jgi:hypothetical protein
VNVFHAFHSYKRVSASLKVVAASIKSKQSGSISYLALFCENFCHMTLQIQENCLLLPVNAM